MNSLELCKEVSTQSIRHEASRLFVLALAGHAEGVEAARKIVLGPATPGQAQAAAPFLLTASPPYAEEVERKLRYADLLVSLPGGPELTALRPADTLLVQDPNSVLRQVLLHRPTLSISLARRFPGFREPAANAVIRSVARANAEFTTITGVSKAVDFLAPLLPVFQGTDALMLTKNQVLMIFRLAAIYGEDLDPYRRLREALPVVAGAVGWRMAARALMGLIPGPAAIPFRAAIAYSGTYAAGKAAEMVFNHGRRPSREELQRMYQEGSAQARDFLGRMRKSPGGAGSPETRPEPTAEAEATDTEATDTEATDTEATDTEATASPSPDGNSARQDAEAAPPNRYSAGGTNDSAPHPEAAPEEHAEPVPEPVRATPSAETTGSTNTDSARNSSPEDASAQEAGTSGPDKKPETAGAEEEPI